VELLLTVFLHIGWVGQTVLFLVAMQRLLLAPAARTILLLLAIQISPGHLLLLPGLLASALAGNGAAVFLPGFKTDIPRFFLMAIFTYES